MRTYDQIFILGDVLQLHLNGGTFLIPEQDTAGKPDESWALGMFQGNAGRAAWDRGSRYFGPMSQCIGH